MRFRHDKALTGDRLEHADIDPCGFEDDVARDFRDRVAVGVAPLGHPTPYEILIEALGRLAGGKAALVALADPIPAAVRRVDLVGEHDPARRIEAKLVFRVDEDQTALLRYRAAAREQPERQVRGGEARSDPRRHEIRVWLRF